MTLRIYPLFWIRNRSVRFFFPFGFLTHIFISLKSLLLSKKPSLSTFFIAFALILPNASLTSSAISQADYL